MSLDAPFRVAFDNARDPYTARNTLGVVGSGIVSVTSPLSFTDGTLSITNTWTSYTPTIVPLSGAFTSVSATGQFLTVGKLTHVQMQINIVTNGTAAGGVVAGLPNTANSIAILTGRDRTVSGKMLQGNISAGATTVTVSNYDNTYPGASGALLALSGAYENT